MMKKTLVIALIFIGLWPTTAEAQTADISRRKHRLECRHDGIRRCRQYHITDAQIPAEFDNFHIAFIADTHYASRFDSTALRSLGAMLTELSPDLVLLGGDYQEGCEYVEPLFSTIMQCRPPHGAAAVMGNNDYERCTDVILKSMADNGIRMVEGKTDTIARGESHLIIAGVRNHFGPRETEPSPTIGLSPNDFVILLTHTPDYAEDVDIANTDLVLAGHTHGGQVTLFGLFAPVNPSHYGQRFVRGLKYNSAHVPMIITNGIGTSRKNIRLFAPSEIVEIILHSKKP